MENKVVFCNISWMKNYCGYNTMDKGVGGGSFVAEHDGECMEQNNFLVHNHKCYGYVQHKGQYLSIERVDKDSSKVDVVKDVTVVWVAKNPKSGGRYIVGWYKNATMYREWQWYYDVNLGAGKEHQDFNFEADSQNCYLIPVAERTFEVPGATSNGRGKGMGQSNIWYADGKWAKTEFVPEVLEYLQRAQAKCNKLFNDFSDSELAIVATDIFADKHEIYDELDKLEELSWYERDWNKINGLYNLAVEKDPCADTYYQRANNLKALFYIDEAMQDLHRALVLEPKSALCKYRMMESYETMKNYKEAVKLGEEIMTTQYENIDDQFLFELYDFMVDLYGLNSEDNKALEMIRKMKNVKYIEKLQYVKDREKSVLERMEEIE